MYDSIEYCNIRFIENLVIMMSCNLKQAHFSYQ